MKKIPTIKVTKRELKTKGQMNDLRKSGILPASIYSRGEDSLNISVNRIDLLKLLSEHGKSSVLNLKLGSKSYNVMVREMQTQPLTFDCIHVTFQHVFLDEATKAEVPLQAHGLDEITRKGFEFVQQLDMIPVTGLPNEIPSDISIDVSEMEAGDTMYVRDITFPKGIVTDMEEDRVVFSVSYPRIVEVEEDEQAAEGDEEVAADEVPLVGDEDTKPEA